MTARNRDDVVVEDVVVGIVDVVKLLIEEGEVFVAKRSPDLLALVILVQGVSVVTQNALNCVLGNL